jgi:formate dehydrogenase major subunit
VSGLGTSFGFGAATNPPRDMVNSDCVLVIGSNMAESHPVGFHWPLVARERGATIVHVDPRFTRTSAAADVHVAIRPGTDLAFLAGLIRHVLETGKDFRDYVLHFTNAATLLRSDYAFDEATGLFSGWNPATRRYDLLPHSWDYDLEPGPDRVARTDPTLQDPRCVYQILRRHFARYTPEVVADSCGCRPADVVKVAELLARNSGRDRTSNLAFALGFTQHSTGPQTIRAAAILQLLLGNMGRPGGGITALRGHANVQGATDIPTLWNVLPNYLPLPHALPEQATLAAYLAGGHGSNARRGGATDGLWQEEAHRGAWSELPRYLVSLLKAWYGEASVAGNDFGYDWLPKITGDFSYMSLFEKMRRKEIEGAFLFGQNVGVSGPNARLERDALRSLRWLVVLDLFETESASCWYADPQGPDPASVGTEVFLLPVAASTEKSGSMTNTERLVQWHEKAAEPPGDARPDLEWVHELGARLKALHADSALPRDAPIRNLTWDYGEGAPDPEKVLREINGFHVATGEHLRSGAELADDGSVACGSRLYAGVFPEAGKNLARRITGVPNAAGLAPDFGWAWPGNARILYNRCSADAGGRPWSERKMLVWWDETAGRWTGLDAPQFPATKRPDHQPTPGARGIDAIPGDGAFHGHLDGKAWLFAPFGLVDGPLPVHYEPFESPFRNALFSEQCDPLKVVVEDPENAIAPAGDPRWPLVATTYHLTEHFISTRMDGWLVELQPAMFVEIGEELAGARGVANGDWVVVSSARGEIEARALVTPRMKPLVVHGRPAHVVGIVNQFGYRGEGVGDSANDLTAMSMSPDSHIESAKSFTCELRAGRVSHPRPLTPLLRVPEPRVSDPVPGTPWAAQPFGRQRRGE